MKRTHTSGQIADIAVCPKIVCQTIDKISLYRGR
jgi:hypothetical protein